MKWAITDQFHQYLYGNTFNIYTDVNPLTNVLSTAKLDMMGHRWITGLTNYNFHIHYKSGKSNIEAGALSRIDWEKCDETIQADSIQAIVAVEIVGDLANIETISCSVQTIEMFPPIQSKTVAISKAITNSSNQSCITCLEQGLSKLESMTSVDDSDCVTIRLLENKLNPQFMTIQDWVDAQSKDKIVSEIVLLFKFKKLCSHKINENDKNDTKQFIRQHNQLFMRKGVLYHKTKMNHPDRSTTQLVLPEVSRKQALQGVMMIRVMSE